MAAALVPEPDIHTAQGLVRLMQTLGSASPSSSRTLKQGRVSTVLFSSVPGPEQILIVLSTCPCRILREQVSPTMQAPQPLTYQRWSTTMVCPAPSPSMFQQMNWNAFRTPWHESALHNLQDQPHSEPLLLTDHKSQSAVDSKLHVCMKISPNKSTFQQALKMLYLPG